MALIDFEIVMPLLRDAPFVRVEDGFERARGLDQLAGLAPPHAPGIGGIDLALLAAQAIDGALDLAAEGGTHRGSFRRSRATAAPDAIGKRRHIATRFQVAPVACLI